MLITGVLVYLVCLGVIGVRQLHRTRTGDDFFVAGRTLPAPVLSATLLAAWIGSGTLFAGAGLAYRIGFAALWQSAGTWVAIAVIWKLAPRIHALARYTIADIFEQRYGRAAGLIASATIITAYTTVAAFQFGACGHLLALLSGLDTGTGTFIVALFCIGMTAVAGLRSVAWVDACNALVMVAGLGAAVLWMLGLDTGAAASVLRADQLTLFGALNPMIAALVLPLPALLLLAGDAGTYQKLFAARGATPARRAVAGWLAATMVVEGLIVTLGVYGSAVLPGLDADASQVIVIHLAARVLPPVLALMLATAAAAIIVSTANTFLLAAATSLIHDVYGRVAPRVEGERDLVWPARYAVALLGIVALTLLQVFPTLLDMALWALTMYGAVITPPLLAAFVWPRATPRAAVAAMLTGAITTAIVQMIGPVVPAIFPALVLSVAVLMLVSRTNR
jgi:Na+/proline symporter